MQICLSARLSKNMTEVEVCLIAQNLQFRKIFRLPRSRWAQIRDRVINVPVPSVNIANTIKSLPKNPSESGLIGVNWKRKIGYKNTHKRELVDINRVFSALEYLVNHNPSHKDSSINTNFLESCKLTDPEGHDFFIDQVRNNIPSTLTIGSDEDELFLDVNDCPREKLCNLKIPRTYPRMTPSTNRIKNIVNLLKLIL